MESSQILILVTVFVYLVGMLLIGVYFSRRGGSGSSVRMVCGVGISRNTTIRRSEVLTGALGAMAMRGCLPVWGPGHARGFPVP